MFLGSYQHTIDDKGRLTLPAKWRAELASGVVVTRGVEDCLFIFPQVKFEVIAQEIDAQGVERTEAREWARYIFGMADQAEVDKQGRILIPQILRDYAKLDGDVVVVGVYSRIEIWHPQKYKEMNAKIESDAPAVAERMGHMIQRASVTAGK